MHFILSWDINAEGTEWDKINSLLKDRIEEYSWVRPLRSFYIIRVSEPQDWHKIRDALIEVAKSSEIRIHFLIGPLMYGGEYDGWLPEDIWSAIEERIAE